MITGISARKDCTEIFSFNTNTPDSNMSMAHRKEIKVHDPDILHIYFQRGIGVTRRRLYTPLRRCVKIAKEVVMNE